MERRPCGGADSNGDQMTVVEAAAMLGVSRQRAYQMVADGELKATSHRLMLVRRADVEALLQRRSE